MDASSNGAPTRRARRDVSLVAKRPLWFWFPAGIFATPALIGAAVVMANIDGGPVEFFKSTYEARTFVLAALGILFSSASLLGLFYAIWFWRRGGPDFDGYDAYIDTAIRLVLLTLVIVDLGAGVFEYMNADPGQGMIAVVIFMMLGAAFLTFVGFPVMFAAVFVFSWLVFEKHEASSKFSHRNVERA